MRFLLDQSFPFRCSYHYLFTFYSDLDSVDLDSPEWSGDINNVASVMKMWLRELPDPLLTAELQKGFIEAASGSPLFRSANRVNGPLRNRE